MPSDRVEHLFKRWRKLRNDKSRWHDHWDDLARVQLPRRLGFASTTIEGERRTDDIFDGTPMQAARGLANAIGGLMRPTGLPEVEMQADDDFLNEMDEVKDWFSQSEGKLNNAFNNPKARFREVSAEFDQDLTVFGTAVKFAGESRLRNNLLFQSIHLKDATIGFNEEGMPDEMFLEKNMPGDWLVDRFGKDKLSAETLAKLDKNPDDRIRILHVVLPRKESRVAPLFSRDFAFADQWFEVDAKNELFVSGFHEFPFIVARWDTTSGEDYGRSPGMIALPDSDTLQAMGETILIAGQRAADPPLGVPNDGSFDAINTFPGGLAYYDVDTAVAVRGSPFFPIESSSNLAISRDMQRDTREQIFAAFFKNVLNLPVEGPEMTATEIIARKEEFMREIGPTFGKLETTDTAPTVERGFMIMLRAGAFNPIPEVLQGRNIRFIYDSPVKRIKDQIDASAARLWASEIVELAQAKPEALDLINADELGRFSAKALGIPREIVNTEDVVADIREARQQVLEAQEQAAALQQGAEFFKTGAEGAEKAGLVGEEVA
jgi:hypothetical protein